MADTNNIPGDADSADGVRVGESPVPGVTLRKILRSDKSLIKRIAWSPDGHYLASPSANKTIYIWDVEQATVLAKLEKHGADVISVSWSPDGKKIASASADNTIHIWDGISFDSLAALKGHSGSVHCVAWSPDSQFLASGSLDRAVQIWSPPATEPLAVFNEHKSYVFWVDWSSDGKNLASSTMNGEIHIRDAQTREIILELRENQNTVYSGIWHPHKKLLFCTSSNNIGVWNVENASRIQELEGHTSLIKSLSLSPDERILVSKADDHTIRLWNADTFEAVVTLKETAAGGKLPGVAFHPRLPILATLGENDAVIRIWDIDSDLLLGNQPAIKSVHYTTAKVVLVGDSGVGKTGLGWRLAHGEFKEHASTHGQQFWVVDELGTKRDDGTECEAVLWDLAGQHVYRSVHAIFLDDVDLSLVLFDPTNRQEPLKGAQFWLEQLAARSQLPPTVLVGARADRGAPALSQAEIDQFCQRYGISGGYIGTSALSGEGIDTLTQILKAQIPWERKTTTVTTETFKRIKDYVLALKAQTERKDVLVRPAELRRQLEASDSEWQFSDAEMMTAVRHLANHGYVTVLQRASGEEAILLAPELLISLASSVVLLADRHPRELGALSETTLLKGEYQLQDLAGLQWSESQVLLDAAVSRFLDHNICFREALGAEALLIFPALIKQKRPLLDDVETTDDVSYVVRGRVENVYAALVVLLGYTQAFTRVNQWQSQAQYELGSGEICGFRLIEEREGEIELVLYYSDAMPSYGRTLFQGLFEKFLYQRDVDVTRFPPVVCPNGHRQERATVVSRLREGKVFMFCAECGAKAELPRGEGTADRDTPHEDWIAREGALARLRSAYETHLVRVKGFRRDRTAPRCFLSRANEQAEWAGQLAQDLRDAGVYLVEDRAQVGNDDAVLLVSTPAYKQAWDRKAEPVGGDARIIRARMHQGGQRAVIALVPEGDEAQARSGIDFRDDTRYPVALFDLVLTLYAIPLDHPAFAALRASLRGQWQRTLAPSGSIGVRALEEVGEEIAPPSAPAERYVDFELHIAPDGRVVARSSEGEVSAEIQTQAPRGIRLALKLIAANQADAELLQQVGEDLYDWLLPGPIHTHFHQTDAIARLQKAKVRLRLHIEAPSVASLPLELLYRSTGGYYLSTNPGTVLSRYLNLPLPPERVRRREGPLHMLAIIADPSDRTRLDVSGWEALLKEALVKPLDAGELTLDVVKHATRREIRDALLRQKPDIIQLVGHGSYANGKGQLALVDEDTGGTWAVDDEIFASIFLGALDRLGLICLAACQSASSDDPQAFAGVAPQLVQRGVPAVLAMQYEVDIASAAVFLEDFYAAIAARKPFDWATQSARNAVMQRFGLGNREFATPVLYMRAAEGGIF